MTDFESIIGYGYVKKAFAEILITLNQSEVLAKRGVSVQHTLLLSSCDHFGKTFMAKEFAKATGREEIACGFDTFSKDTANALTELYFHSDKEQKYIVILTDFDRLMKEYGEDAKKLLPVIDEAAKAANDRFFFVATAEDRDALPPETAEYFRDTICIDAPALDDTREIYRHLLAKKNLVAGMDEGDAIKALAFESYRSAELILEKAIIFEYRKYPTALSVENEPLFLHADSFTNAILDSNYNKGVHGRKKDAEKLEHAAVHEAGHALAAELLQPGIVGFIAINENIGSEEGGGTFLSERWKSSAKENDADVIMKLAGKAAEEVVYGRDHGGASSDIRDCYSRLGYRVVLDGLDGLEFTQPCRPNECISETQLSRQEQAIQARLIRDYDIAKRLITENRKALDELSGALRENMFVPASVIRKAVTNGWRFAKLCLT